MISGQDFIFVSNIEWNFLWQSAQEIALRLGQAGNRVLYVENTGVRPPGIRDAGRVASRLKRWATSLRSRGVREVAPGVYVCSPLVLPPFGRSWRRFVNRRFLLPLIKHAAHSLGMRDVVIWTFLPTDTAIDLIFSTGVSPRAVIYHCQADFAQLTPHAARLRQSEKILLGLSDLVFVTCRGLAEHCSSWSEKVHIFSHGVDLKLFSLSPPSSLEDERGNAVGDAGDQAPHRMLETLPRPVIGYVGGLHRFVDFELLAAMARARPGWSWVFDGPLQTPVGELSDLPNVHMLGQQPHHELIYYLRAFDVCIIPYLDNAATATVVPIKLNE